MKRISLEIKEKEERSRNGPKGYKKWMKRFLGPPAQTFPSGFELSDNPGSNREGEAPLPIETQGSERHRFPKVLQYFFKALFSLSLFIWWISGCFWLFGHGRLAVRTYCTRILWVCCLDFI